MAYNIGQFRRTSNISDYYEEVSDNFTIEYFKEKISELTSNVYFENAYYEYSNKMNKQSYYYLDFSVKKMTSAQTFYLKLKNFTDEDYEENTSSEENNEQIIAELTVPKTASTEDEWVNFEVIIAPNKSYGQLYWDLRRTISSDYRAASDLEVEGVIGRRMQIVINKFAIIKNVIQNINKVVKIGVQGPPSLLMCINGEQIRIGKTGIFEINEQNVSISFVGFVPKIKNGIMEYFIMDYEYN